MNKCPVCKTEDIELVDSSENITYSSPELKSECSVWEQYDCLKCGVLLEVEDGTISVKKTVGLEYKTVLRYSTDWERKIEESFNHA